MPILHVCTNPGCGRQMSVADEFAGMMVRCPGCGKIVKVTEVPQPAAGASAAPGPLRKTPTGVEEGGGVSPLDELGISAEFQTGPDVPLEQLAEQAEEEEPATLLPSAVAAKDQPAPAAAPPQPPAKAQADAYIPTGSSPMDTADVDEADALGTRTTTWTILALGMAGILIGFLIGLSCSRTWGIIAAYAGAGLGWLAGLAYGLVMVLGLDKSGLQRRAAIITCNRCGMTFSASAPTCPQCSQTRPPTMSEAATAEYVDALSYGLSNIQSIAILVCLYVLTHIVCGVLTRILPSLYSLTNLQQVGLTAAAALVQVTVAGYFLKFLLSVTSRSIDGAGRMPDVPRFCPISAIATAFRGVGVLLLYVVPAVTIPLLPLGVLALGHTNDSRAYNLSWAGLAALKRSRELAVLWLMLLVWGAAMALVLAVVLLGAFHVGDLIEQGEDLEGKFVALGVSAVGAAAITLVGVIFGAALFRCIGIFGRANQALLGHLPRASGIIRVGLSVAILLILAALAAVLVKPLLPS